MAHYAFINRKNVVTHVIVGRDEDEVVDGISDWEAYYGERAGQTCLRTSYNGNIRYNYAGIGFTFDSSKGTDGAFIPPKPYESWTLDEDTCLWEAPVPMPEDGEYVWNEESQTWDPVS